MRRTMASGTDMSQLRIIVVCALTLGAGVLAGCGGGSSPPASPTGTAASTTTAPSKLAGLTADQVLAKAKVAAESAKSVKVKGEIVQGTQSITIDLKLTGVARGTGVLSLGGGRIDITRIGNDLYFKADEKTLGSTVAQGDPALITKIAGRYIKATATTPGFDNFAGLLDLVEFEKGVLSPTGKISRVDGKAVGGVPTVGLKDAEAKEGGGILYIADRGEPYPLQIIPTSGPGVVTMSEWDVPVTVTAPPADQVVDAKSLE